MKNSDHPAYPIPGVALLAACLTLASPAPVRAADPEATYEQVVSLVHDLILGQESAKLEAAARLGEIRAVYSVPALQEALSDPSAQVRLAAVKALGGIAHKDASETLKSASVGEDHAVALAAVQALGNMHTQASYNALMKLLGKVDHADLKQAVLAGIKKWNKPFTPLPDPVALPDGKDVPPIPEKEPPPEEKPEPEKKPETAETPAPPKQIDIKKVKPGVQPPSETPAVIGTVEVKPLPPKPPSLEPDVETAFTILETVEHDVAGCLEDLELEEETITVKVTVSAGGGVSQVQVLGDIPSPARACTAAIIMELEFPPASASYALEYEFPVQCPEQAPPEPQKPALALLTGPAAPPLMLELSDLTQTSAVSFDTATAKMGAMPGRITTMSIQGGWTYRWIGVGATIPFSGGTAQPDEAEGQSSEHWVMNNVGLWIKHAGSKDLEKLKVRWGASLTFNLPTATSVPFSPFGMSGSFYTAAAALYAGYGAAGEVYPNLEKTLKVAVTPTVGAALDVGPVSFQLQMGFDFVVLDRAMDPDEGVSRDLDDVTLMHLGFGALVRPLAWLQASLELTSTLQLGGKALRTYQFDSELLGRPLAHEMFVTPGLAFLLPVGQQGSGHISLGLRIPVGQIGGANGNSANPLQLEPILLLSTGFRWKATGEK